MVSVVIPTYNRKDKVITAIRSVLEQNVEDIEIIVVDDGSTDGTSSILASLNLPIRIITEENGGVSKARNTGIRAANGNYVAFLDSDDMWLPGKLEAQFNFLQTHTDFRFVYTDQYLYEDGKKLPVTRFGHNAPSHTMRFPAFVDFTPIQISTVLMDRKIFDVVGYFDESLQIHEDSELWNRISEQYKLGFIEQPLSVYFWNSNEEHLMARRDEKFITNSYRYLELYRKNKKRALTSEEENAIRESEEVIGTFLVS